MKNFKQIALNETTLSPIMAGREKRDIDYLMEHFPEGVTLNGFDFVTITDKGIEKTFPVFTFAEDEESFFMGGFLLSKIARSWVGDGDAESTSDELREAGGVKVKFKKSKTKSNNNITMIEVI